MKTGDKVTIISKDDLFNILKTRNFCLNDKYRELVSKEIGGTTGIVHSIEEKYSNDYFFYMYNDETYSIPVQSILC